MKYILLLLWLLPSLFSDAQETSARVFTAEELREDLDFWQDFLERKHPLLYLYRSKASIDSCFEIARQQISGPMDEREFYLLLAPLAAFIQDGHNSITPSERRMETLRESEFLFPLQLAYAGGKLYVSQNLSGETVPPPGAEIIAIGDTPAGEIVDSIWPLLVREGHSIQLPLSSLVKIFRFYYHLLYGVREEYPVVWRGANGEAYSTVVKGRALAAIQEAASAQRGLHEAGIRLEIIDSLGAGVLTIRSFHPPTIRKQYGMHFRKEVSGHFRQLQQAGVSGLVLDLRGNEGGNPAYVRFALQYLFDKPFTQAASCRVVKKRNASDFFERTRKTWFPAYGIGTFSPKKNSFKGDVVVLTDEGTFSAGVIMAGVLKKHRRAVVVGRETGGNPVIMAGYLIKTSWELPHTRLQIAPGTLCTIYEELSQNTGSGLIPDYLVNIVQEDITGAKDTCLEFALGLITNGR